MSKKLTDVFDITYADLVAAIGASKLTVGQQYRITDFKTRHYLVDGDNTRYGDPFTQIDTVTLTGTSGTANITGAGGLTKLVTFNSDLTTTAADFVTAHAAAYLAVGIEITSADEILTFTAHVAGTAFTSPVIANVSGDLNGTVDNVIPNYPGYIEGDLEPLIVQATSANTLSPDALSETFPQDKIVYDWDSANWLADISFATGGDTIIGGSGAGRILRLTAVEFFCPA